MKALEEKIRAVATGFATAVRDAENAGYAEWCVNMGQSGIGTHFDNIGNLRNYMLGWHVHDNFRRFPIAVSENVANFSARFHADVHKFYFPGADNPFVTAGFGDQVNAQDHYFLFEAYQRFAESDTLKVLDFGAGYCRTLNFLSKTGRLIEYCAVDGNENSYMSQFLYLLAARETRLQQFRLDEHFLPAEAASGEDGPLRHIPTWALPTIPDEHYDIVLCNQVLPELTTRSFERVIRHLHRVLKTSGILFIRDHSLSNMPGHRFHDDKILTSMGCVKEYEPFLVDCENVHGVPRIYRKSNATLSPHKCLAHPVADFPLPDVFSEGLRLRMQTEQTIQAGRTEQAETTRQAEAASQIVSITPWLRRLRKRLSARH